MIVDAPIAGGNNEGMALVNEPNVANETGIEDRIDGVAVVDAAMRLATHGGALSVQGHYFFSFGSRSMEAELMQ